MNHSCLGVSEEFGKSLKLVLDLVCEFTGVANHKHLHSFLRCIHLLETSKYKDSRLTHARLRLAEHIGAQDRLWDALVPRLLGVFEAAVNDRAEQLWLQEEITEPTGVDRDIIFLLRRLHIQMPLRRRAEAPVRPFDRSQINSYPVLLFFFPSLVRVRRFRAISAL